MELQVADTGTCVHGYLLMVLCDITFCINSEDEKEICGTNQK